MSIGSILLADDEETFRESTSRLLGREGFNCHCVKDPDEALESLRQNRFELLISDIRMPRNLDLRLLQEARKLDRHLPVILVTGYPSAETAIRGIDMAVDAYLTKPLDMADFLAHVRRAIDKSAVRRRLSAVVGRLHSVVADLEAADSKTLAHVSQTDGVSLATVRTLASCLSDLLVTLDKSTSDHGPSSLCELLDCPQRPVHRQAILLAIEVLEKTKDNFRSKQLAELRTKLERTMGGK